MQNDQTTQDAERLLAAMSNNQSELAARIIGAVGNVTRFPTKGHFASYAGTAPVEASSGETVRHRLSLAGNRHLNYALHMVATCQASSDLRGAAY
jgi:transposase